MNLTELARRLKISPSKLREVMPQLGFDIGARAIKIDSRMANDILEKLSDPKVRAKYLEEKVAEMDRQVVIEKEGEEKQVGKMIQIPEKIVVKELAKRMGIPVTNLVLELMKNGVMASLNQDIDFDTASIIAEDLGYGVDKSEEAVQFEEEKYEKILKSDEGTAPRPPVVVVMGHVDHGKTKLLDAIRETNIVDGEAGGITQHIGAYQVEKDARLLTFIDTPGHEAFSAMRSRGVRVADIAILVVAADDGVQPQTIEAISHIRNAGLPFIVAINKIDKPGANLDKVKSDLANVDLTPEDWGGKTICVEVSAKEGTNILKLLDTLFLVSDLHKDVITADTNRPAAGTIIESHIDKGEGPVATVLVQVGTLKQGDLVKIGGVSGKIRLMKSWTGDGVNEALPSMPVKILGLKNVPQVGDILEVLTDKKELRNLSKKKTKGGIVNKLAIVESSDKEDGKVKPKVKLMLKADVLGSAEAIIESLEKFENDEVGIQVVKQGLGNITENDVEEAKALGVYLTGFHVKVTPEAKRLAVTKNIGVYSFDIIYDLIDFVETEAKKLIGKKIVRTLVGKLEVLVIFRTEKKSQIVGGKVLTGKLIPGTVGVVKRREEVEAEAEVDIVEVEAGKQAVSDVQEGQECGIKIEGYDGVKVGDILEIYMEEEK